MFYAKIGLFDIRNRHIAQVCYADIRKRRYIAHDVPLVGGGVNHGWSWEAPNLSSLFC